MTSGATGYGQILHSSATTTEAVHRSIQNSQARLEGAFRYGIRSASYGGPLAVIVIVMATMIVETDSDVVIVMDSDDEHRPQDIPCPLAAVSGAKSGASLTRHLQKINYTSLMVLVTSGSIAVYNPLGKAVDYLNLRSRCNLS